MVIARRPLRTPCLGSRRTGALTLIAVGFAMMPGSAGGQATSGCGPLTVTGTTPRARLPQTLVPRQTSGRLRLYMRDVTQRTQATARLTVRGRRSRRGSRASSAAARASPAAQNRVSFELNDHGRCALRRAPRPRVRLTFTMVNGAGRATTLRETLRVRTATVARRRLAAPRAR